MWRRSSLLAVACIGVASCCTPSRWFDTCALPCTDALVAEGRAAARGNTVALTWADHAYAPMLARHWLPNVMAAGLGALVVAADEATAQVARSSGARAVVLAPLPNGTLDVDCPLGSHGTGLCMRRYHMFAYTKLSVPRCLVAHGLEVLALDADAMVTADLLGLARSADANVATIMDGQYLHPRPGEHSYLGPSTWGLPVGMRRSIGGAGARLGHCLGVAHFRGPPAAALLERTQRTFIRIMAAWWWDANATGTNRLVPL